MFSCSVLVVVPQWYLLQGRWALWFDICFMDS